MDEIVEPVIDPFPSNFMAYAILNMVTNDYPVNHAPCPHVGDMYADTDAFIQALPEPTKAYVTDTLIPAIATWATNSMGAVDANASGKSSMTAGNTASQSLGNFSISFTQGSSKDFLQNVINGFPDNLKMILIGLGWLSYKATLSGSNSRAIRQSYPNWWGRYVY